MYLPGSQLGVYLNGPASENGDGCNYIQLMGAPYGQICAAFPTFSLTPLYCIFDPVESELRGYVEMEKQVTQPMHCWESASQAVIKLTIPVKNLTQQ